MHVHVQSLFTFIAFGVVLFGGPHQVSSYFLTSFEAEFSTFLAALPAFFLAPSQSEAPVLARRLREQVSDGIFASRKRRSTALDYSVVFQPKLEGLAPARRFRGQEALQASSRLT